MVDMDSIPPAECLAVDRDIPTLYLLVYALSSVLLAPACRQCIRLFLANDHLIIHVRG